MSKAVLRGSCCHGNSHLLDEFAPAPGADLAVSCAHEVSVGGQQAEDGTFVSWKAAYNLKWVANVVLTFRLWCKFVNR